MVSGELMSAEMGEQPEVLARLLARRNDTVAAVRGVVPPELRGVVLVARGSSDNAALHARYLMEMTTGRPVALAAPSLWTRYGAGTSLRGWLAVAVSQSGRTPEIIETVDRMHTAGARVIAVTNAEGSELEAVADVAVLLGAGEERAVPATKTVTSSILALAHIAVGLGAVPWVADRERRLPDDVADVLSSADDVNRALEVLGEVETVHLGRGYTLPVALEAALKIKETSLRHASGYATADFLHGPVAAARPGSGVVAYAAHGPVLKEVVSLAAGMSAQGLPTVVATDAVDLVGASVSTVGVPAGLPEPLAAISLIVRAQQLAYRIAQGAGLDPDRPAGLSKITITR
jgi:glucosamine--fructose-6-phosphate aminotransferase (isomerizing)